MLLLVFTFMVEWSKKLLFWSVSPKNDSEFAKQHCCKINKHEWAKSTWLSKDPYKVKAVKWKIEITKRKQFAKQTERLWTNMERSIKEVFHRRKKRSSENDDFYLQQHTQTRTRTHASQWLMLPILNITPQKQSSISLSAKSPFYPLHPPITPSFPLPALHPTCSEACWHTWLRDSAVLFLMMNYASAAVSLKNAITTVIRQMGLFCLAYAVHLLNRVA